MATMPLEAMAFRCSKQMRHVLLASAGACLSVTAHAQAVQTTFGLTSSLVQQTNIAGTKSQTIGGTTRDWVSVLSPGLKLAYHGPALTVDGAISLDAYHYERETLKDQVVPKGNVLARLQGKESGLGLEAGWLSRQVPSQFFQPTGTPNGEYTLTEWHVGPFFERQLGSQTYLKAKLDRSLSHQTNDALPDSVVTTATAAVNQNPLPVGYLLKVFNQDTKRVGSRLSLLKESKVDATGLYALTPELDAGALVGAESIDVQGSISGKVYGGSLHWHPQDRTSLKVELEKRFFGNGWLVDVAHRMTSIAVGATFNRKPSTSATSQINNGHELYARTAQLRQESSGKMELTGRRDVLTFSAGKIDAAPLTSALAFQASASKSRDYFFNSEWVHKLTPTSRLLNSVRWTRSHFFSSGQPAYVFGREFAWIGELKVNLSETATATFGLKRKIVHTTNFGAGSEGAVFAGLDYAL